MMMMMMMMVMMVMIVMMTLRETCGTCHACKHVMQRNVWCVTFCRLGALVLARIDVNTLLMRTVDCAEGEGSAVVTTLCVV